MTKARDLANASTALSAVSATELAFVDGVTSAIQTQIDTKAPSSTAVTLTDTQTLTNKTLTSPVLTTPTISTVNAKGDLLAGTADNTIDRIAVGANDTVLTADSTAATGMKWATAAAGGMTLITETNASGATSISFTSIAGTYKHLLIVWSSVYQSVSSASAFWGVRLNNDSTSKYTYNGVVLSNDTILASHQPTTTRFGDGNDAAPIPITTTVSTDYDLQASGKMMIFDYAGNDKKVVQWQSTGGLASSGAGYGPVYETGLYNSTSAITQIDFVRNSTQTCTGNFKLYGVS